MKKEEFKNLINECVKEVMLEEKAAKKGKALKQIKEIADEHGITKDELNEIFGLSAKEKEGKKAKAEEIYAQKYKKNEEANAKKNDIDVATYHKAVVDYLISTNLRPGPATYDKDKGKMVSAGSKGATGFGGGQFS